MILFLVIINPLIYLSQNEEYRGNAWNSILVRNKVSDNYNLVFDIGYRTFDEYIKRTRQGLIRGLIERKISNKHSFGIGIAYFESISSNFNSFKKEIRPFVQYQFVNKNDKSNFSLRFRSELRNYIEANELVNRARIQLSYEYEIGKYLFPRISFEQFVSFKKKLINEQRFGISNTFTISEVINFNFFYILQFQSNIKINNCVIPQNILGLQLILNMENK